MSASDPRLPHSIPKDDFGHQESHSCSCRPYAHFIPGMGAAIVHNAIRVEDVDWEKRGHTFPDDWEWD